MQGYKSIGIEEGTKAQLALWLREVRAENARLRVAAEFALDYLDTDNFPHGSRKADRKPVIAKLRTALGEQS